MQFLVFCLFIRNGTLLLSNGCGPIVLSAFLSYFVDRREKDASKRHLRAPERKALGQLFKLSWLIARDLVLACQALLDVLIEEGRHVVFCSVS